MEKSWGFSSGALLCAGAILFLPAKSPAESWREMRKKPAANFYDILRAYEAQKASEPRKTRAAGEELFEELEEGDYKFERWRYNVEPRVAPSGDLSLLSSQALEMRQWMGLDGEKPPANAGDWRAVGPTGDPAGRTFTGIPSGNGRLNFIRFHPTNASVFFVGSPGGGLWISRNAGTSWSPTSDRIASLGVADVAVDPKNPSILYLTTGDRDGGDTRSVGVLKSTDGGATWNTTGLSWSVTENKEGGRLLIHPDNTQIVLHAGSDGVYRSTNGGATFTRATGISGLIRAMEYKPGDPNTVYAAGSSVYYSADGGQTWSAATGPSTLSASRVVLAVSPAAPNNVWAYTSPSDLHVSTNSGRSYTFLSKGADARQSNYNLSVAVSHTNPNYIVTGQVQMKRSDDGGRTWTAFQTGSHWDVHLLEFLPGTNTLFSANDGGIYRSVNGGNWVSLNAGLQISQQYRLGVSRTHPDRVCTGLQDNGSHLLIGSQVTRIGGADGFECFFDNEDPNTVYIEIYNGSHQRCTWNGTSASCTGITSGLPGGGLWDTPWGIDPNVSATLYTARAGALYKSTNRGSSWSALGAIGGSGNVTRFAVARSNSSVIYAIRGSAVYRSADGGQTWAARSTGLSGTLSYVSVDPANPERVFVSVSGYTSGRKAFRSTNGGQSWTAFSEGLPNLPANTIIPEGGNGGGVYLGMDVGVYYRNDGHSAWQPFFDGLPHVSVRELEIGGTGSAARLKAATYGRGLWQSALWGQGTTPVAPRAATGPAVSDFQASARRGSGFLDLQFHLGGGGAPVVLVTAGGRVVFRDRAEAGFYRRRVDLSGFGKGAYVLRVGEGFARRIAVME